MSDIVSFWHLLVFTRNMKVVAFVIFVITFYSTLNEDIYLYILVVALVVIVRGVVSVVIDVESGSGLYVYVLEDHLF